MTVEKISQIVISTPIVWKFGSKLQQYHCPSDRGGKGKNESRCHKVVDSRSDEGRIPAGYMPCEVCFGRS